MIAANLLQIGSARFINHGTLAISKAFRMAINSLGYNNGVKDPREIVILNTLRHTFASWLAMQGETLQTIGELLGHKDLTMTRRYSHLTPDHKRRATLALEKGFQDALNGNENNINTKIN